jgi:murein DD-endopeptidase MepM/ murein hydrolase activator NlpD
MRVVTHRPRQHPAVRLAVAALGFAVLGLGWKMTSAEPATPRYATAADALPSDYVPEDDAVVWTAAPDPAAGAALAAHAAEGLGAPLDVLRVTSNFGMRRHPILGFSRMHQGVDFGAPEGSPVLAAADGVVTDAGRDGGYGNLIRIRHAGGWATGYAHLMGFAPGIAAGAPVLRGEVIGFVGRTGLATGPHLHYEVSLNGVKLDPLKTPYSAAPTADLPDSPSLGAAAGMVPTQQAATALRLRPAERLPSV